MREDIASFGTPGTKTRECCGDHNKPDGMVGALARNLCGHPGCTNAPIFGPWESSKPEFCAEHPKEGMTLTSLRGWGQRRAWKKGDAELPHRADASGQR